VIRPGSGNEKRSKTPETTSQPSHSLTGLSAKRALASVWFHATRHGYENKKPKAKANEA
jgi:hypothetical protein